MQNWYDTTPRKNIYLYLFIYIVCITRCREPFTHLYPFFVISPQYVYVYLYRVSASHKTAVEKTAVCLTACIYTLSASLILVFVALSCNLFCSPCTHFNLILLNVWWCLRLTLTILTMNGFQGWKNWGVDRPFLVQVMSSTFQCTGKPAVHPAPLPTFSWVWQERYMCTSDFFYLL